MYVYHCEQVMITGRIPLISGRIQYDHLCTACGHQEREIVSPTGVLVRWMNLDVRKKLAQGKAEA